jgi:starch-binding outer membrane protein, SusD/RagB family
MKKIYLFILVLILSVIQLSCEKSFLDVPAIGSLDETILATADGVNGLLVGCYATLNDGTHFDPNMLCFGGVKGGELFKGSDPGDQPAMIEAEIHQWSTGNTAYVLSPWRGLYTYIDRCNTVLKVMKIAKGLTDAQKVQIEAETRFIRAHYYFKLKILFLHVPWLDENSASYFEPNTVNNDGVTYVDCWPQILADMDFARTNLPATQTQIARPNKWAADIYYAKMLMYTAGYYGEGKADYANNYAVALPILTNAITNGRTSNNLPYNLLSNYYDNFDAATENKAESVFAVQLSVNDYATGAGGNGNSSSTYQGSNNKVGPTLGRGWGFYTPTPWWGDHFRTSGKGLPYLDMFATNSHRLKTDQGMVAAPASGTDPFVPDTCGLDPRIDWSMGRRGIPYYDYGNMPGKSWQRNQDNAGPYIAKKTFIQKSQAGTYSPSPAGSSSAQANNIYIIRFSDVLLLAAECEARVGSLDNARTLVNRVRQRMVSNSTSNRNWVKKADGTNAANYRIKIYPTGGANDPFQDKATALHAILYERTLELGMEGSRFFDVVRFGEGEQEFNGFIAAEKTLFDFLRGAEYTTIPDAYLPIPQTAVDNSQVAGKVTMTQNPGY